MENKDEQTEVIFIVETLEEERMLKELGIKVPVKVDASPKAKFYKEYDLVYFLNNGTEMTERTRKFREEMKGYGRSIKIKNS